MKKQLLLDIGGEGGGIRYYKGYFDIYTIYFSSSSEMDEEMEFRNSMSPFYHSFRDLWYNQEIDSKGIFEATEPSFIHDDIIDDLRDLYHNALKYNNVEEKYVRSEWIKLLN